MGAFIGSLNIGMSVKTQKFKKNLNESRSILGKFGSSLKSARGLLIGFGAALGAGALVSGLRSIVKEQLSAIDKTSKFADEMGLTIQQLKGLELQTGLSGSSLQNLEKGLQRLVRRLGEAKAGFGQGIKGLDQLGLSAEELTQVSTFDALKKISEAIKNQKGPGEQAAAAYALFGKQGLELLTFLKSGAAAMDASTAEADALGLSFARLDGSQVEAANDALLRMSKLWEGVKQRLTIELAPIITGITQSIVEFGKEGSGAANKISGAVDGMTNFLAFLADTVHVVYTGFLGWRSGVTKSLAIVASAIGMVGKAIKWLVNLLPNVESNFSDTTNAIADDLHKLAAEQFENAKKEFNKPFPSDQINKFRETVKRNVAQAAQAVRQGSTEMAESFDEGMLAATESANKFIDKLKDSIATFGMSANEAEIWKLQQQGASQALIDQARALDKQIQGLEKLKKAQEEAAAAQEKMKTDAQAIFESTRTPMEKFKAEFKKIRKLYDEGLISRDTYFRAIKQTQENLFPKKDSAGSSGGGGLSAAVDFASAEARSIVLRSRMSGQSSKDKVGKDQLKEQKKSNEHLAKIAENKPQIFTIG